MKQLPLLTLNREFNRKSVEKAIKKIIEALKNIANKQKKSTECWNGYIILAGYDNNDTEILKIIEPPLPIKQNY